MENKEIVEISEKDIKKKIDSIKKRESKLDIESDYAEKRAAMALLGFGNKSLIQDLFQNEEIEIPEIKDKEYIGNAIGNFIDEMIKSSHIDLDLLQDLVKIQNNIEDTNINMSNEVKEILLEDKILEKIPDLSRENNLKRLKANIADGRIDENQEWIDLLKENTDYNRINVNDEEMAFFLKQQPVSPQPEASVQEKSDLKSKKQIPVVEKDMQEYWRERYIQKMEEYGLTELKFNQNSEQIRSKYNFENNDLQKIANAFGWLKSKAKYPFEETSIVKLDDDYNIPTYQLFKESRFGKGVKFSQLPEPGHDMAYELAALKVRESGIQNPYVYATKPRSNQDLIEKNRFIENQINALIEYADYDINDISVPKQFQPVLDKIKREQEMKQAQVLDMSEILQKVIDGNTNKSEREMFLDFINITQNVNGEEQSLNFDMNDPEDVKLLQAISEGSKIKVEEGNENDQLNLLKNKFKFAESYKPEAPSQNIENEVSTNLQDNEKELKSENKSDIDLDAMTLNSKESEIIANPKILQKFQDYEGQQTNPESNVNETLEAIISLKNKLSNPEIADKLDVQQKDMVERKATIAETFKEYPQLDDSEKGIIRKVLENGNVANNYSQLEPAEQGILAEAINKYGMQDFESTMNRMRGLEAPKPDVDLEQVKQVEKAQNQKFSEEEKQEVEDKMEFPDGFFPQNDNEEPSAMQDHYDSTNDNFEKPNGLKQESETLEDGILSKKKKQNQKKRIRVTSKPQFKS